MSTRTSMHACMPRSFPRRRCCGCGPICRAKPIVVIEGRPPHEFVCSMNRRALSKGIVPGMTRLDVEGIGEVRLLARSNETEAAARAVMLECVSQFSPRIEEAGSGTACAFVLDITGTERLFGTPAQLAERMRVRAGGVGFRSSIAVSANFDAARMMAAAIRGITIIAEGEEASALANLPIRMVAAAGRAREKFLRCGEFARSENWLRCLKWS